MRYWLLALYFLISGVRAQDPFPGSAPPTLTFNETYVEEVRGDPDDPESDIIVARRTLKIEGTAPLIGYDLSLINEDTTFAINVGGFDSAVQEGLSGYLTDDESWNPDQTGQSPDRTVDFPIIGYNYSGDPVKIGTIALRWTPTDVKFSVTISTFANPLVTWGFDQSVLAEEYIGTAEPSIDTTVPATFSFGPFAFDRSTFVKGKAEIIPDPDLSAIKLDGAIDSVAPTITVTQPPPGKTELSETDGVSADFRYTLSGTVADKVNGVDSGTVEKVEVRIGGLGIEGEFTDENVELDENGSWTLPDAQLQPGMNTIDFRVTDGEGNVFLTGANTTPKTIKVNVTARGSLTIRADAQTGYPADQSGVGGTVSIIGPPSLKGEISAPINGEPAVLEKPTIEAGLSCTAVAKAGAGSVFNGWEGALFGNLLFTSANEQLVFETKPGLVVTARFVPNTFGVAAGTYQGLITGDSAAERGLFKVKISKTGAFTGKVQIGALTLPLKGKVLGDGTWFGAVKKGTQVYTVTFGLNVGADNERSLTGTVTGNGLEAELTADLKDWRKAKGGNPARLVSPAQVGTYNVLLSPLATNEDPNFPQGIGYGRVTITPLGGVKYVGRLGDGSPVSASSTLVQRKDGTIFFPLFIPLDNRRGNVAGPVTLAAGDGTDLTGVLDWEEPTTGGVQPLPFAGEINFGGARYTVPAFGQRVMLEAESGRAQLSLSAPVFTKPGPPRVEPEEFAGTYQVTLDTQQTVLAPSDITGALTELKFKLKFNAKTGLFSGSYKDPVLRQTVKFNGAVVQPANAGLGYAAGVFTRGNRAGAIVLEPRGP